jgi:vacuolar-type H+-ATPase subunit E/Vma4
MKRNSEEYNIEIKRSRRLLERYDYILDSFIGEELDSLDNIPELSRRVLEGENISLLYMILKDSKRIIQENYSDTIFPIDRILDISQKIQKVDVGLKKLNIRNLPY